MQDLIKKAGQVKLLVMDVDGILSNGQIIYDANGIETKAFSVQDGVGVKSLTRYGVLTAIITGRRSAMVDKRAAEMGVNYVVQGRDDKLTALNELLSTLDPELDITAADCAYMGDDLPDIKAMQTVGFAATVPNAHAEVIKRSDMVTTKSGGTGAVREVCDLILKGHGHYQDFIAHHTLDDVNTQDEPS
ncbi:HAD hydrolase family protein [Psychrobacter sp. F1192]|uniref:3-deoxy-D-manno-octulosonate 8-phosphate phosphatase KdsC n=1 Tax=Psychrobacter coccoides TaxID=2818440 RepID=A0ABS3NLI7_9GAMM|nr:HAD hydrolase family protein [Psychrobacter coccoides]MBO1530208.1 HAD hydrolase family protein [Psychrobacter coccoides]